jgi:hypothetical protein
MEETTFLEDFLQSVELLPNDVRRDFELMREHDRECSDLSNTISSNEKKLFQQLKKMRTSNDMDTNDIALRNHEILSEYEDIKNLRNRLQHRALQKVNLAANMLKDLEKFIHKLDTDLAYFENDLRGTIIYYIQL